jgi:diaminohydroxyphosphoribosylaminopyrimidine deaminase / 5-amino-6-(5-phosphoribosylamino)uracil reductase
MTGRPDPDRRWLLAAVELSRSCPVVDTAYAVGAIIVGPDGREASRGYSRETNPTEHAEEAALRKAAGVATATMYTSLEPCTARRSRSRPCTELILSAGIRRVVFAMREPPLFADCHGAEALAAAGVEVVELPEFADLVRRINGHLIH